jgi:hypothetical protein
MLWTHFLLTDYTTDDTSQNPKVSTDTNSTKHTQHSVPVVIRLSEVTRDIYCGTLFLHVKDVLADATTHGDRLTEFVLLFRLILSWLQFTFKGKKKSILCFYIHLNGRILVSRVDSLYTVCLFKFTTTPSVRSQARPRGSEAHRLRKKPSSWTIVNNTTTQEDGATTRQLYSWRRKTRYKLDEEAPLTTPIDVSVLRYYRWRGSTLDHTPRRVCSQVLSFRSREFWLCSVGKNTRK